MLNCFVVYTAGLAVFYSDSLSLSFLCFFLLSFLLSTYFSAQCLLSVLMQDEYLTVLYIKHFHSLCVDMSGNGHRMLVVRNPGVHLAHWYIINTPCNCSSKHTDVSPVGLPCQCVYAHVCLCMCVSPVWVLGLCKVAKVASVLLNQVWRWIVLMFPGVCVIPAQWQPSFHTMESDLVVCGMAV